MSHDQPVTAEKSTMSGRSDTRPPGRGGMRGRGPSRQSSGRGRSSGGGSRNSSSSALPSGRGGEGSANKPPPSRPKSGRGASSNKRRPGQGDNKAKLEAERLEAERKQKEAEELAAKKAAEEAEAKRLAEIKRRKKLQSEYDASIKNCIATLESFVSGLKVREDLRRQLDTVALDGSESPLVAERQKFEKAKKSLKVRSKHQHLWHMMQHDVFLLTVVLVELSVFVMETVNPMHLSRSISILTRSLLFSSKTLHKHKLTV